MRQALELDDDDTEEFEGFGPQHAFDFGRPDAAAPGAHPVDADPAAEAQVYPAAGPSPEPARPHRPSSTTTPSARGPRDAGAPRCPSWDEIVFGAKPE